MENKKHSFSYDFWKCGYDMEVFEVGMLAQAVICEDNRFGDITPEEFKEICGEDFVPPKDFNKIK